MDARDGIDVVQEDAHFGRGPARLLAGYGLAPLAGRAITGPHKHLAWIQTSSHSAEQDGYGWVERLAGSIPWVRPI